MVEIVVDHQNAPLGTPQPTLHFTPDQRIAHAARRVPSLAASPTAMRY